MAQTRLRPEQARLDLDWNITGHLSAGEDGIIAATRLLDIDGVTTGFGAVLTPSMAIDSPLFYGLYTRLETEVAAITVTDAISLFVEDPIKGAGSTMTNLYGLCIEDLTQGTARNWAVCIRGDNPIVWANDTNLYRGAANVLKTDDSFQATRVFTGDGLVGSPAHSFISDVDIGMYRIGVNDLGFTTNSTLALELNAVQQALITAGTAAAPGLAFISDPDLGFWRSGVNRLNISVGNQEVADFGPIAVTFNPPLNDVDFIVEAVGVANAFFVQGSDGHVGIGTGTPTLAAAGGLHISAGASSGLRLTGAKNFELISGGGAGSFQIYDVENVAVRLTIDATGALFLYALKSGANQAAAGAGVDELWHDTDDESIKIGV